MNRQEFMRRLEELLNSIPASEREDALGYYNDYFDEAGEENEYQVIFELGSPEAVAEKILADVQQDSGSESEMFESRNPQYGAQASQKSNEKKKMSTSTKILIAVLLVLTFPLWIGIVAGAFGLIVGILGAIFGIVVGFSGAALGLVVGGVACIFGGILCLFTAPVDGLVSIGVGAILTAVGILLAVPCVWCVGVWLPNWIKALVRWIKGIIQRRKGGNEI